MIERKRTGQRILIFQQRGWALQIGHHLARRLQADGATLGAITFKKSTDRVVRTQTDVAYAIVISHDAVMENPAGFLDGTEYSIDTICTELGVDSIWPIVQSMRLHVRTYQEAYYYSYRQNISDEGIKLYVQAAFHMCKRIFTEFKPDVILSPNFVALPHIFMNLYAAASGVPMIGVTDTKVRGVLTFSNSYDDSIGPFNTQIDALNNGKESKNSKRALEYIKANSKRLAQPTQLETNTVRRTTQKRLRELLFALRESRNKENFVTMLGESIDARGIKTVLRDFIQHNKNEWSANRRRYVALDTIENVVFFPLQFQPEASIDVISPRFNNQIETARQIAMSLPGAMTLVVKDHPAMLGYRSSSYLDKVARTPNVNLIDYRVPTEEILRKAKLVVAATGTVLAEAAMLHVPAIQLGQLGTTRLLPNVTYHTDVSTLSARIKEVMMRQVDRDTYEDRLINYVSAAYDVGFDHNYYGIWERGENGDRDAIYKRFENEIDRVLSL